MNISLQEAAFQSAIDSELFSDQFQKLPREKQLAFIRKLQGAAGLAMVANLPPPDPGLDYSCKWLRTHRLLREFSHQGYMEQCMYERWWAIWKVISTETYAVLEESTRLPGSPYYCYLTIWGKKPPVDLPEGAIVFKKVAAPMSSDDYFKSCEFFFNDKCMHLTIDSISVRNREGGNAPFNPLFFVLKICL